MKDVMVDIETLSTKAGGALVSVGACYFGERVGETFYRAVRWQDEGLDIDPRTLHWWLQQSNVDSELLGEPRFSLGEVLDDFAAFLSGSRRVWAKGPDFDLVLLRHLYSAAGKTTPWHFRESRDVRTMLWLGKRLGVSPVEREGEWHNALSDAVFQAKQVMAVLEEIQ